MSDTSNTPGDPKRARVSLFGGSASPAPAPGQTPAEPPAHKPKPKPRRRNAGLSRLSAFLSFALIGAFIGLIGFGAALVEARKAGPLAADKVVQITREDDGGPIAEQLERAGVIDSAVFFSGMTLIDGSHSALKRGEYEFKAAVSPRDVEQVLLSGKVVLHSLTIPEGLTSDQIVQRLRDNDVLVGDVKEPPREGSLLPETYKFARGETRQALLAVMTKAQAKAIDDIWKRKANDLPIKSPGELVTLASVVEKETGKVDERPRVAGVFVNRLQKHMRLQSDPTIVYGLVFGKGTLGHPITRAELDTATPYNTYNIDGLPPGPICNPGKAALEAAANPLRSKELYFVADGSGGHAFSETLDQHLKNVARWRQIEKDAKDRLAPDTAPPGGALIHGEAAPINTNAFGALAPTTPATADAKSGLSAKLTKLAGSLRKRESLLGAGGALTAAQLAGKSIDSLGAVVTGVNDEPDVAVFNTDENGQGQVSGGPVASVPLSPAALAEQRALEAKYGGGASASAASAPASAPMAYAANGRPRIFDASEGTALDPLLNKTYDLTSAKDVPNFRP